jgi:uncharacterized protein YdbL (DUF1318 family)
VQDLKTISAVIEAKKPAIISNEITMDKPELLFKNVSQQVDGYLSQTAEHDATQQLAAILNLGNDNKREELINNATKAIEGLISIKAEKIAQEATKSIMPRG